MQSESQSSKPAATKQTPAVSFAQCFVKRGGCLACPKCLRRVDSSSLPHRCKEWRSR